MTAAVRYLSTLNFGEDWLASLRDVSPRLDVRQITATSASEVAPEVWAGIDVLHTSAVFPTPEQAPNLQWIQLDTSGVDHVRDLPIWNTEIPLVTIGGISPVPLAEYVMFAILGVAHRLPEMLAVQRERRWPDPAERWDRFLPDSLPGRTVGIVGYGRIGREIGRLARAHGMNVLGLSRSGRRRSVQERGDQADFGRSEGADDTELLSHDRLPQLVRRSDFVVVVVPLTDATRGMIDSDVLDEARPGTVLIDVARGGIVDEAALRTALRKGRISAAVLDVFADEPLPTDSPWWVEPNVFVTPHVSGLAPLYAAQVGQLVADNLRRFLDGRPLINTVDRTVGY
jgi:phosphoglycerate dehydrogenase-like enzyme